MRAEIAISRGRQPLSIVAAGLAASVVAIASCGGNEIGAGGWKPGWSDDCPVWSPDGTRLAFGRHVTLGEDPSEGAYIYNARTGVLTRLLRQEVDVVGWSSNGRELVVVDPPSQEEGKVPKLLRINTRTRRRTLLLDFARTQVMQQGDRYFRLVAAPNLRRFAFERIAFERKPSAGTWIVEAPSGRVRRIERRTDLDMNWSPNGRTLAYSDLDHVFLVDADTGSRRMFIGGEFRSSHASAPLFSPNGRRLAYQDSAADFESAVYVVDFKTRARRQVTKETEGEVTPAAWSPDGSLILANAGGGLLVTDLRGHVRHRLPEWGGPWFGTGTSCPSYSPDGRRVAFLRTWPGSFGGGASAVYVAPSDLKTAASPEAPNDS